MRASNPNQRIKLSIYARRNPSRQARALPSVGEINAALPGKRRYLTDAEFNEVYGADPADLKNIEAWAKVSSLKLLESSVPKRRVLLEGTVNEFSKAFSVQLNDYEHLETGPYGGREGKIYLP
ncbi:MAG: protease pro-enzyme activation domain-containing protein, partial [Thermoguttaceae bacterium]